MKIIEVVAKGDRIDTIARIASQQSVIDYWLGPENEDGRRSLRLLVNDDKRQSVLDTLQMVLETSEKARIIIIPTEAVLPKVAENKEKSPEKKSATTTTREELYNRVEKDARLDANYLLLVFLSTLVVAIGLLEDNVAVVIGAMVIAPLLGPNLALALAAALGDTALMWRSLKTSLAGLTLALVLSVIIGLVWPLNFDSRELLTRTHVGLDSAVLALASGAAAVLSMTTGLPSVLVGVMVAVALLPPTATLGLMLGANEWMPAMGAGLLLAVNIVCVNLSAKIVFRIRGTKPRTWLEQQKAKQSMTAYISFWVLSLLILAGAVYLWSQVNTP